MEESPFEEDPSTDSKSVPELKNRNIKERKISQISEPPSNNEMIDKLRTIKPFNEKQLLSFYQNSFLENNKQFVENFVEKHKINQLNRYYEALVKLERSTEKYQSIETIIENKLKEIEHTQQSCWNLSTKKLTKWESCEDGQRLEQTISYQHAEYNPNAVADLDEKHFKIVRERILNEQMVSHYTQRYSQLQFELDLYRKLQWIKFQPSQLLQFSNRLLMEDSFENEDDCEVDTDDIRLEAHREDFHSLITALFVYFRRDKNLVENVVYSQFKQSLLLLCHKYLTIANLEDRFFLLNHILRCQSGSSVILKKLLDCPDPLPHRSSNYQFGKQIVDFNVTVIATILSPIKDHFMELKKSYTKQNNLQKTDSSESKKSDQWLLVDDEFEDEEISVNSNDSVAVDLISYLSRVPFENCLKFMGLGDDIHEMSSIETGMMKLFAFDSRLIQILRSGLENFHCLRYKELTLFLSSMIKQIIRHSSSNWILCKEKYVINDQALLLRLQVEFDNFMLRSITALLSTNRRGVWPLLAQVEFIGITEQMLWHILWVVYNNGLDKTAENVGGLCPYMSANYWKDMFARHHQWKFVFLEKISEFTIEEAQSFMDFLFNMAMSRQENGDSDFLEEIVRRISEICLLKRCVTLNCHSQRNVEHEARTIKNQDLFFLKGTVCLISLLNHFKTMISFLMQFIDEQSSDNELIEKPLIELFQGLELADFVPNEQFFKYANKWIIEKRPEDLLNRVGRIALSKVKWNQISFNSNSTTCLLIEERLQRQQANYLFLASQRAFENNYEEYQKNFKPKEKVSIAEIFKRFVPNICDSKTIKSLEQLSISSSCDDFLSWISRLVMILRVHPLSFVPDEASLDEIIFFNNNSVTMKRLEQNSVNFKHRIFLSLPKPTGSLDSDFGLMFNDLSIDAEKQNPFAYYIIAIMSEWVVKSDSKAILEKIHNLFKNKSYLLLHFVNYFTLMNFNEKTHQDPTLIQILIDILHSGLHKELTSVILHQLRRFRILENAFTVSLFWTEMLLSMMHYAIQNFNKSSWLSSMNPTNYLMRGNEAALESLEDIVCYISNIMDQLCEAIIFHDDKLFELYVNHYSCHRKGFFGAYKDIKLAAILEHPSNRNNLENFKQNKTNWNILGMLPWSSKEQICREVFFLTDKNCLSSEYLNPFMILLRQNINKKLTERTGFNFGLKKQKEELTSLDMPLYLVHVSHEINLRRFRDIWALLVSELNLRDEEDALEKAMKAACKAIEINVMPLQLLPINSLIVFLLNSFPILEEIDVFANKSTHPLLPLLWRSFYQLYFSNSEGASSVGLKLVNEQIRNQLTLRLNLLYDQHNERWKQFNNVKNNDNLQITKSSLHSMMTVEERMFKFYKSCKLWLNDPKLHSSYVNFSDNPDYISNDFQCELFKSMFVRESNGANLRMFFLNYINKRDVKSVEEDETYWLRTIRDNVHDNGQEIKPFMEQTEENYKDIFNFASSNNDFKEEQIADIEKKICEYSSIINYFSDVSSLINIDLLSDEYLECFVEESPNLPEFSAFLMIIHQLVDCVVEEARLVENQLSKYNQITQEFTREVLPNLYKETRRVIKKSLACDRQEFDAMGCKGNARFVFEFNEWNFNDFIKQKNSRLNVDFNSIVDMLTHQLPVQKVVASIYFLNRVIRYIERYFDGNHMDNHRYNLLKQLFQSMTGWIHLLNSVYSVKYIIIVQVLDIFLELLSSLSDKFSDHVNHFILDTALQKNVHSSLVQQLAPILNPAKFQDPKIFIEMYKLIGENIVETPQQTIFVLLSKFDLVGWLRNVQEEPFRVEFIQTHLNCLKTFGLSPNEEFIVTFDLYRKHLQDLLLINFPNYLPMIVEDIFDGMIQFKIAPKLWNSILHTFGFYTKSLSFTGSGTLSSLTDFDFSVFESDLVTYVYRQTIFNSHDLFNLCQLLISMHTKLEQTSNAEILDHYKVYVGKYIQFLGFISFCWIQTNSSRAPDDIEIIWTPLIELWRPWIFVKKSTKFVPLEYLSFTWQMWIEVFKYGSSLLGRFQDKLLSLFWQEFLGHVLSREQNELDVKDVEMFEDKLLLLNNWNRFAPSLKDIELMYEAIIQDKHSLNRFVSFVITKIDWTLTFKKQSLSYEQLAQIIDNLSCVLICLSEQPNILKLDLNSIPFGVLDPENVKQLCFMLFPTIKSKMNPLTAKSSKSKEQISFFKNSELEDSFDLSLLYAICNLNPERNGFFQTSCNIPQTYFQESWLILKMVYYTNCVSSIITHFCNANQTVLLSKQTNPGMEYVRQLLKIWCENIQPNFVNSNCEDQILLFNTLLNFFPQVSTDELQAKLVPIFTSVMSYSFVQSDIIGSLIIATNRTITSKTSLIYLLEAFVELFLDLNGEIIFLINNLHFNGNHSTEELLSEIKNKKAFLLFLIFIYSRLCNPTVPEKCTLDYVFALFQNETQLKITKDNVDSHDEAKLLLFLTKTVSLLTKPSINDTILPKLRDSSIRLSFVHNDSGYYVKNSKNLHNEFGLKCLETVLKVCKNMDEFINEAISRSWFFFKSSPKYSNWCLFSIQILILHAICSALEIFYPNDALAEYETIFSKNLQQQAQQQSAADRKVMLLPELEDNNRFKTELFGALHFAHNRLFDTWRKDKAFVDVWHTIDAILILFNGRLQRISRNSRADSDNNPNNVPFTVAEHLSLLQTERFNLIHSNLLNKLNDTNFVKSYL